MKEPFIFRAFEDNCLTLLVQARDQAAPLAGSLSFARRMAGISPTQQLPLCQLGFDFSSSEPGHCIMSQGAESVAVTASAVRLPPLSQLPAPV